MDSLQEHLGCVRSIPDRLAVRCRQPAWTLLLVWAEHKRSNFVMSINHDPQPLYAGSDDPDLVGYYPKWLDNLADDVTLEGSLLDGVVVGKEGVRAIVIAIRALYDRQEHKYAGTFRDDHFIEEYIAVVRGEPIGCVVLVTNNAEGKAQRIVASYRPRSTLVRMSRLLREKFAGTPHAELFAPSEPRKGPASKGGEAAAR
jgi:hypothetical protein